MGSFASAFIMRPDVFQSHITQSIIYTGDECFKNILT